MTETPVDKNIVPDARHFIWVARNLLWQAHAGFVEHARLKQNSFIETSLCDELKRLIETIDQMRDRLVPHDKVPCQNTTMPPGAENAWKHFLEHVQDCYLQRQ